MAPTSVWTRSATICVVLFLGSCGEVQHHSPGIAPEPTQEEKPSEESPAEVPVEALQASPEAEAVMAEAVIIPEPLEVRVEEPDAGGSPVTAEEATPVTPVVSKSAKTVKVAAKADPRAASRKTVMVQEAEAVYVQSEQVQRSKEALVEQGAQVTDLQMEVWDYRLHRLERHAKRKGWSCDKDPGPIKEWERHFWTEWCELKPKVEAVRGPVDTHTHDWELEPDGR